MSAIKQNNSPQQIVESVSLMMGYCDKDERFLYANRSYLLMNNVTPDQLGGTSIRNVVGDRLYKSIHPYIKGALKGQRQQYEVDRVSETGEIQSLRAIYEPDFDREHNIQGFYFIIQDISDQLIGGNQPRVVFDHMFKKGPVGMVLVDNRFCINEVNDYFCNMVGYRREEILGKSFLEFTHPDDRNEDESRSNEVFDKANNVSSFQIEKRYVHKDGHVIHANLNASVFLSEEGIPIRGVAFIEDISERKLAEERLRHADRMKSIGELSGGMAHDFNNLLSIVLGNLDLMLDHVSVNGQVEQMKPMIQSAISAAERGASLTQRLLAFARKQTLEPEALNLNDVVEQIEDLIRHNFDESVSVNIIPCEDLRPCKLDRSQLENALMNLTINARDAMAGQGGELTIKTANITSGKHYWSNQKISGQYVMIAISDTGCGMTKDVVRQAVDPFFTTKDVGKGSGLGLSMVYGFVEQSGGHLVIDSEAGQGTNISIYLPVANNEEALVTTDQGEVAESGNGQSILLVEDDDSLRSLTSTMLQGMGYQVIEARDGPEALSLFDSSGEIDLLLSDVVLPRGMDGTRLAQKLTEKQPDLNILYMSGYTENAEVYEEHADMEAAILQKPFRKSVLADKIAKVLNPVAKTPGQ